MSAIQVWAIPVLNDNYIFVIGSENNESVVVIDPAESSPVLKFLDQNNKKLKAVWNTHHHPDHVGGNIELKAATKCEVWGAESDKNRIPGIDHTLEDNQSFNHLGENVLVKEVFGHTIGHIAFFFTKSLLLFSGDTIFAMGCGRLFEGTPKQMLSSLNWIKSLPESTKIYCTHEYTLDNSEFALHVDPQNPQLQERSLEVKEMRKEGQFTIPTLLKHELETNPFLRCSELRKSPALQSTTEDELQTFTQLRKIKDQF